MYFSGFFSSLTGAATGNASLLAGLAGQLSPISQRAALARSSFEFLFGDISCNNNDGQLIKKRNCLTVGNKII